MSCRSVGRTSAGAGSGECAAAGVGEEGVADGAHGLGGFRDRLVGGVRLVGGAGMGLPPVEFGDDPAEGCVQLVREFPGEVPLVAQEGADAVQYGVQRGTEAR